MLYEVITLEFRYLNHPNAAFGQRLHQFTVLTDNRVEIVRGPHDLAGRLHLRAKDGIDSGKLSYNFV